VLVGSKPKQLVKKQPKPPAVGRRSIAVPNGRIRRDTPIFTPGVQRRRSTLKGRAAVSKKKPNLILVAPSTSFGDESKVAEKEQLRKLSQHFKAAGAVLPDDTIEVALAAMMHTESTRAFVLNESGEVVGVVSFKDIAVYMIGKEADEKLVHRKMQEENDGDFYVPDD